MTLLRDTSMEVYGNCKDNLLCMKYRLGFLNQAGLGNMLEGFPSRRDVDFTLGKTCGFKCFYLIQN